MLAHIASWEACGVTEGINLTQKDCRRDFAETGQIADGTSK